MGIKTIPFRDIEKKTTDIFEAVSIVGRRARQITADRFVIQEELRLEEENLEEIGGADDLYNGNELGLEILNKEEADKVIKPVTKALDEFLNGELEWENPDKES